MTWQNAQDYCDSLGGHLVTITDDEELELVNKLVGREDNGTMTFSHNYIWTGGHKNTSGIWEWPDGEAVSYPVSEDAKEWWQEILTTYENNCLALSLIEGAEGFIGRGNVYEFGFVCEWEPVSTDFAPYSEEYLRYIADPDAYFAEGEFRGAEPEPVDYSHLAANPPVFSDAEISAFSASALEAEYNPTGIGVSPVRDQTHDYRTCWAFAALGTLETSYIHQGYGTTAPDLSELHLAWYTYMDSRYPENLTTVSKKYANDSVLNFGGTNKKAVAFLSRAGVASESDMPYTSVSTIGTLKSNDVMPGAKRPESYEHPLRLKEVYEFGAVTADNRDTVKTMIKRYGAVAITYDGSKHYDNLKAYYHASDIGYGHAVSIVGWNDNYSVDNFSEKPSSNGAWLAKNSYGTSAGENGFFWLSYEQKIGSAAVYVAADSKVNKLYGHDTQKTQYLITGQQLYSWQKTMKFSVKYHSTPGITMSAMSFISTSWQTMMNRKCQAYQQMQRLPAI